MSFEILISEIKLKDAELEKTLNEDIKIEILTDMLNDLFRSEGVLAKVVVNRWV